MHRGKQHPIQHETARSRSYWYLFRLPRGISTMTLTVSISVPLRLLWVARWRRRHPVRWPRFYAGRQPVDGTAVLARRRGRDPFSSLYRRPGAAPRPRPLQLIAPPSWRGAEAASFCCTLGPCGVLRRRLFHYTASGPAFRQGPFGRRPIRVGGGRTRAVSYGFCWDKPKENSAGPALLPSSSRVVYV